MNGLWLALDTATDVASVAIGRDGKVLAGAHSQGARRHAAEILRLVDLTLANPGLRPADLDGIVVGDGPGSFTGLRIGWATAKGLAQEAGLDVVTVPSLLAAAGAAAVRLGAVPIAACFDALRGQVYAGLYVVDADRVATLLPPTVVTLEELVARAPVVPKVVVGDGAVRYAEQVKRWCGIPPLSLDDLPASAAIMVSLAGREGAGRALPDFATAEPEYGRPAEAQAKWEARHGRPLPDPPRPPR